LSPWLRKNYFAGGHPMADNATLRAEDLVPV
jgi:hypothetical protein